ncbi:MAG: sigma-70 family RNA polymerase sigma factor, partial [Candidatus Latescibacteria bacterium]|nr:sigma-70 family RNA polymerase sigma factor [Candidatus Latescibacterota bacterium]
MGDERDPTDGDLVRRFAEGDMAAFANLVTRYQNGVFLFFCRMTGRRADAEDLAQETFVRVYESLHSLDDPTRFRSWFWAIASNLCRDYHTIERDIDLDLQLADMGSARTVELASRIRTALAALDDERRLVVVLREYHRLSYEEIAATVGCSVGAVRWRLHAARQQLRASLSDL